MSLCATGYPLPDLLLAPFFSQGFDYRSSFFAPKPNGNACYAGYGGPREQYRSVPRGGVKKEKRQKKKMIGRGPRERCIAIPRFGPYYREINPVGPVYLYLGIRNRGVEALSGVFDSHLLSNGVHSLSLVHD